VTEFEIPAVINSKSSQEPKMSKNQLKRIRKSEKWELIKVLKKQRKNHGLVDHQPVSTTLKKEQEGHSKDSNKLQRKSKEREEFAIKCKPRFYVIIDCDWEDKHAERPLKSLAQQIIFCYGINRRSSHPVSLFLSGLGNRIISQISKSNYKEWIGVTSTECEVFQDIKEKELVYLSSDANTTLETLDANCAYIIGGIVDRNKFKGAVDNYLA